MSYPRSCSPQWCPCPADPTSYRPEEEAGLHHYLLQPLDAKSSFHRLIIESFKSEFIIYYLGAAVDKPGALCFNNNKGCCEGQSTF